MLKISLYFDLSRKINIWSAIKIFFFNRFFQSSTVIKHQSLLFFWIYKLPNYMKIRNSYDFNFRKLIKNHLDDLKNCSRVKIFISNPLGKLKLYSRLYKSIGNTLWAPLDEKSIDFNSSGQYRYTVRHQVFLFSPSLYSSNINSKEYFFFWIFKLLNSYKSYEKLFFWNAENLSVICSNFNWKFPEFSSSLNL